jgi:hypothetical protein
MAAADFLPFARLVGGDVDLLVVAAGFLSFARIDTGGGGAGSDSEASDSPSSEATEPSSSPTTTGGTTGGASDKSSRARSACMRRAVAAIAARLKHWAACKYNSLSDISTERRRRWEKQEDLHFEPCYPPANIGSRPQNPEDTKSTMSTWKGYLQGNTQHEHFRTGSKSYVKTQHPDPMRQLSEPAEPWSTGENPANTGHGTAGPQHAQQVEYSKKQHEPGHSGRGNCPGHPRSPNVPSHPGRGTADAKRCPTRRQPQPGATCWRVHK